MATLLDSGLTSLTLLGTILASACAGGASESPQGSAGTAGTGGVSGSGGWAPDTGGSGGLAGSAGSGGTSGGASGGTGGSPTGVFAPNCPDTCQAIADAVTPTSLTTPGGPKTLKPASHGDVNPKLRGFSPCSQVGCGATGDVLGLIDVAGPTDDKAPRLQTLFSPSDVRQIAQNHRGYDWDWGCDCKGGLISTWDVHWVGFATQPGEVLRVPKGGYEIAPGLEVRALYVDGDTLTLKYTMEDDVVYGYTLHIVGICPEPGLRTRYDSDHAAGRSQLPALPEAAPLGRACGSQTLVSIRDTGSFMDPRVAKDWWQGS